MSNFNAVTEKVTIVIDTGSQTSRAGFSGEEKPRAVIPTLVGYPKPGVPLEALGLQEYYVGIEAKKKCGLLLLRCPVEHGRITRWDDMVKVWHHIFHGELAVVPEEHPILLTEHPLNGKRDREKITQVMFETFGVPALYLASRAEMSLHASGRTTGLVLQSGFATTSIIPIHNGRSLLNAANSIDYAGAQVSDTLRRICCERGYSFSTRAECEMIHDVKEHLCFVAVDFIEKFRRAEKNMSAYERSYDNMTLGNERFRAPEVLFDPSVILSERSGIVDEIYHTIMQCDKSLHDAMYKNIVLCGGTTLLQGFGERIKRELTAMAPLGTDIEIIAPDDRMYLSWKGGSMFASSPSFRECCISKGEYDENGPSVVLR